MSKRSRVREVVLQILYQEDLNPDADIDVSEQFLNGRLKRNEDLVFFGRQLLLGVRQHRKDIDAQLVNLTENWSLSRMAVTDRNVLRIGAFEIQHLGTPGRVAINEAVELAKRFGSKHSAHFVNGILDRFLKSTSQEESKE